MVINTDEVAQQAYMEQPFEKHAVKKSHFNPLQIFSDWDSLSGSYLQLRST